MPLENIRQYVKSIVHDTAKQQMEALQEAQPEVRQEVLLVAAQLHRVVKLMAKQTLLYFSDSIKCILL